MSDDLYSDEDIPPSPGPSNSKLLNVCLFRKRKLVEEIIIESDSDDSDVPEKISKTVKNQVKSSNTRALRRRQKESDTDDSDVSEKISKTVKNQVKSSKTRALRRRQKESDTYDSDVPEKISKTVKNQVKSPKTRSQRKRQIESVSDDSVVPEKISKTVKNEVDKPKTMSQRIRQKAVNTINTDKKRIRKAVRCEICGVPQQNIWRHMKRAHDTAIQKEDKVKSPKGYITYICPALRRIKGCPATKCRKPVERLRDHLVRTHKIPNGSKQLINLMHKAEPLRKEKSEEKKVREEVDTVIVIDSDDDNVKIKQEHVKIKPEEVKVKAESYISVSDSESLISYEATQVESSDDIMYAQTQKVEVEEEQQSEVIVFYEDKRIKDFVTYLQTQGLERKEAMQMGAEAFNVWKSVDHARTLKSITNKQNVTTWIDKALNIQKSPFMISKYIQSVSKLLMFFIEEKLITEREVSNAEEVVQHIQWTSKMLNAGNKTDDTSMQETVNDSNPSSDDNSDDDQLNNLTLEEEFIDWCQGVPYMAPYSTAQQHMYQAFKVWSYITPKRNVQELLNRQSISAWVNRASEKYEASTVNSYLGSLVRLTTFLKDTGRITGEEESMEGRLQEHIKLIRISLKRKIRVRRTVVETEEIQSMIIPEDIAAFLSSTPSNRCRELALKPPMKVVASDFYDVRDFIIMRILQTNAQRPMAVRGMTHRNISMAKRIEDGGALVTVASHKTAETGPVIISLNGEVYSMVKNLIAMLKRIPNFQHQDNQSIFVSYPKRDGSVVPMTSSHMNKAIQRLWNEGPSEKAISATRLRKATSTHVRAAVPESREVLARHMTHAAATADRYYALYDREQLAMPVSSLISSVMENPNSKDIQHSIHWPKSGLPTPKPKDAIECGADKEGKNEEISDDQISKVDNIDNDVSDTTEDYDVENYFPPLSPLNECNLILSDSEELPEKQIQKHKRRSFTESESETLIAICEQNLKKGKVFRSEIKEIVEKDPRGQKLIANLKARNSGNDTDIWKIIVDRIHAERRRRLRINKS